MIFNRDTWFRLKFWQTLTILKKMKTKMSTIKHSQTNNQMKWFNQIIKQYLKYYMNYQQDNWIKLLSAAQFIYNNSTQAFTEISSFQTEYSRDMQINDEIIKLKENNDIAIQ